MNFESELKKGIFLVNECIKCNKIVWPPSKFCNTCFGQTKLREGDKKGKIIEFSKMDQKYFCVGEFEGKIRIIGTISEGTPNEGDQIEIEKCGIKDDSYYFEFNLSQPDTENT